jgi:uncharacterized protein YndB with AHSA1/START domain
MHRGTYSEDEGRPSVRFERRYEHPSTRVWAAITVPSELAFWFPSTVEIEPRVGGRVVFGGDPHLTDSIGTVLEYEPPSRLGFTWGTDELHFEVTPDGENVCVLTLINVLAARDTAARNASGWTVCLGELDKLLAGTPGDGPHSDSVPPFEPIYESYVADGMPFGATIPE